MKQEKLAKKLMSPSKNSRLEKLGKGLTFACLSLIVIIVAMILIFVAKKACRPSLSMGSISLISYLAKLGILQVNNLVPFL